MSDVNVLSVAAREGVGKGAARAARRAGLTPGVIYGAGKPPVAITVPYNVLLKRVKQGKFLATLLDLELDGEKIRVIPRDVQRDVVRDLPTHVDFLRLSEKSVINLFVPVEFLNAETCPGIKKGGVLNVVRHEVELIVKAGAIPEKLVFDLSQSQTGDTIHISAIDLPNGAMPVIQDRDFTVATIAAPSGLKVADEEEEEAAEEAAS